MTGTKKVTPAFLQETIGLARLITDETLLTRMDSGNDALDNLSVLESEKGADYIIKRNLRRENLQTWWALAKKEGVCHRGYCRSNTRYIGDGNKETAAVIEIVATETVMAVVRGMWRPSTCAAPTATVTILAAGLTRLDFDVCYQWLVASSEWRVVS